jgi:hypothetical protein
MVGLVTKCDFVEGGDSRPIEEICKCCHAEKTGLRNLQKGVLLMSVSASSEVPGHPILFGT